MVNVTQCDKSLTPKTFPNEDATKFFVHRILSLQAIAAENGWPSEESGADKIVLYVQDKYLVCRVFYADTHVSIYGHRMEWSCFATLLLAGGATASARQCEILLRTLNSCARYRRFSASLPIDRPAMQR